MHSFYDEVNDRFCGGATAIHKDVMLIFSKSIKLGLQKNACFSLSFKKIGSVITRQQSTHTLCVCSV